MAKEKRYEYRFLGSKKHKAIAMLLCLVGGFLGLHYFYVNRPWRGAVNVVLSILLAFASGYFIRNRIWFSFYWENSMTVWTWIRLHWREVVTGVCTVALTLMWVIDIVRIAKGEFRDSEKMRLR